MNFNSKIYSNTLIRGIYRALLNNGRTYAGFEERHKSLLELFPDESEILDPMSGYGGLMNFCSLSEKKISSYNIELNPPSYFWQLIMHPKYNEIYTELIKIIISSKVKLPSNKLSVDISVNWFPEESIKILDELLFKIFDLLKQIDKSISIKNAISFILPIVGRLSTCVQGNVVTHVKKGGICVYTNWHEDFQKYLRVLLNIYSIKKKNLFNHTIRLDDARTFKINNKKFNAMITSPPYPNTRDYSKMFAPENAYLNYISEKGYIDNLLINNRLIGSSDVNEKNGIKKKNISDIKSNAAINFINYISDFKETKKAIKDNKTYYIPFYCNYFHGLEKAYENISNYLSSDFEGYIVVVNNTARKKVIPVSAFIEETWNRIGFNTSIINDKELHHVGGINPKVKGLSARHIEYIIKVQR